MGIQRNAPKEENIPLRQIDKTKESEFDNGQCISMEEHCDYFPDCEDQYDKEDCDIVVFYSGYMKWMPPFRKREKAVKPVDVNVDIKIFRVISIDE